LKALIVIDNLYVGGVATSLYNYLQYASKLMECTLLVFNKSGIDEKRLPDNVKILNPPAILQLIGKNRSELMVQSKSMALLKIVLMIICKLTNGEFVRKLIFPFVKSIGEYDLAVSYAQDDSWKSISKGCNDYVIKKVNAKQKAAVVHCDYENFGGYDIKQVKIFSCFDKIICVSESCGRSFARCFPSLDSKVITCENFTDTNLIINNSHPAVQYPQDKVNFVSVCRLSVVKGLARTVSVFKQLCDKGFSNFTWTIVGDGPEYNNLINLINDFKLQDKIFLVGNKNNPYPYIKNASAFLLPSYHEAAPMVYGESAVLGVPFLTTKTCSAVELVENRGIGIVCENSEKGIYNMLEMIMSDKVDLKKFAGEKHNINEKAQAQLASFVNSIENLV